MNGDEGQVEQIGPPGELYEQPRTASSPASGVSRWSGRRHAAGTATDEGIVARVPQESLEGGHKELRMACVPRRCGSMPTETSRDANRLEGTVKDVSYIGVSTEYIIETAAGDELTVFAQKRGPWRRGCLRPEGCCRWTPSNTS